MITFLCVLIAAVFARGVYCLARAVQTSPLIEDDAPSQLDRWDAR